MILLHTDHHLYYNVRLYFRNHILPSLANDDRVWREEFHRWLAGQGACIQKDESDLVRDILDVAAGYDKLCFNNDHDASLFLLRWS
jgi:hypothetical protein